MYSSPCHEKSTWHYNIHSKLTLISISTPLCVEEVNSSDPRPVSTLFKKWKYEIEPHWTGGSHSNVVFRHDDAAANVIRFVSHSVLDKLTRECTILFRSSVFVLVRESGQTWSIILNKTKHPCPLLRCVQTFKRIESHWQVMQDRSKNRRERRRSNTRKDWTSILDNDKMETRANDIWRDNPLLSSTEIRRNILDYTTRPRSWWRNTRYRFVEDYCIGNEYFIICREHLSSMSHLRILTSVSVSHVEKWYESPSFVMDSTWYRYRRSKRKLILKMTNRLKRRANRADITVWEAATLYILLSHVTESTALHQRVIHGTCSMTPLNMKSTPSMPSRIRSSSATRGHSLISWTSGNIMKWWLS